jgi:hypothetical protein
VQAIDFLRKGSYAPDRHFQQYFSYIVAVELLVKF